MSSIENRIMKLEQAAGITGSIRDLTDAELKQRVAEVEARMSKADRDWWTGLSDEEKIAALRADLNGTAGGNA